MSNPLLDFSGLPRFPEISPEHVAPAVDQLLDEARAARERTASAPPTWEDFVAPLEDANERLGRAWGQVAHLHAVMDAPPLREAYNANLPKVTQYWTELGQDTARFEKYKAFVASPAFAGLSTARKKILENELRDFRLGGAELSADRKKHFGAVQEELSRLAAKFSENLLDATNVYELLVTDHARLAGMPDDELIAAKEAAEKEGKRGWKFTLHAPSFGPLLQYAADRALREEVFRASVTRASEFGKPEWDNGPLISRIIELRKEQAALLGYASYAEVSLARKMARSPAQVLAFLEDLSTKARPHAERDAAELRQFAKSELGLDSLESWDVAYASEQLRQRRYSFSDQDVKQYFAEDAVVKGLFGVVERLYGIRIAPESAPVWHEDVRFYDVRDTSGALVGQFYFDLYARDTKRSGAWMDDAIGRRRKGAAVQTPVTYLTCNFQRPVGGKPALFTHDDVLTLFHEFGHGLHHLLTRIDDLGVSGLNGVEWDAVELPSQFMENFCWEWEVVRQISRHVESAEPLPEALFRKMLAAKNFQSGLQMLRQIEFSIFDMRLYSDFDPRAGHSALDLLKEVRNRIAVLRRPDYDRFPNSFGHIFGGGYAAGYYSYKWAEVLSADAYSLFEEKGVLNPEAGRMFRDEILAVGGSRPAADSFRAFRGREPRVDALLRHSGMIPA